MRKPALCVLILVILFNGCIRQPDETSIPAVMPAPKPTYDKRIGVSATAYDWCSQKTWSNPSIPWNMIDPIPFLASHGFNWLRVGVTMVTTPELESGPPFPQNWRNEYWCSREYALQVMQAGVESGMHLSLFFYLSDTSAHAAKQKGPVEWENYTLEETALALEQHTFETTKYYKDKGLKIELYEIGNEIEFGICWYSSDTKLQLSGVDKFRDFATVRQGIWTKEAVLLKSAIEGVKQADPEAEIVLHVSTAQYPELTEAFFRAMNDFGVPYDYGGLSYYPWTNYHPNIPIPPNYLELSVDAIAKLRKQTIISEVSFPSGDAPAMPMQNLPGHKFSLEGQAKWIRDFLVSVENNPNIKALFYFYPEQYLVSEIGPTALFIDDKHPKPAIYEFARFQSATLDVASPVIKSVSPEPKVVKNGDTLNIIVTTNEAGLYVTLDISQLDSNKTKSIMLKEEIRGIYQGKAVISAGNHMTNGVKMIKVSATDNFGNVGTAMLEVELKNPPPAVSKDIPNDTFHGTRLDVSKWNTVTSGGGNVRQDERLIATTSGAQSHSKAITQSVWDFMGDFDVQVDWEIGEGWSRPIKGHVDGATLGVVVGGQSYHLTRLRRTNGGDLLFAWDSAGTIGGESATQTVSGQFRLARAGSTLTLLYDIGNGWRELTSGIVPLSPAKVYLANGSVGASHAFTTYFDNFRINSGVTTYKP